MLRNKKSTLKFLSYGTAFSFLSFLSFNILFPPVATNAESSATANLELEIEPSIEVAVDTQALALSYNNETDILPTSEGVTATGDVNVYVTTNGASGYILSLYTQNSTNSMKHINTNISNAITATAADAASLTGNTWGYKLGNDNWNPVSASAEAPAVIVDNGASNTTLCDGLSDKTGNPAALEQCVTNGSASKATITFGANITDSLPAGRYTNDVVFSAISKDPVIPQETTMQDFDPSSLAEGESTTLVDARDGNKYTVKKFGSGADAEVWMTQNLTLGYDQATDTPKGLALTSADTNIPADDTTTYYLPPAGYMGSTTSSSTTTSTTTANFNDSNETYAKVQYAAASATGSTNPQPTGYYNFNAASLGYSGYYQGATFGDTPRDICPKGWQLPVNDSSSHKSWYYFYNTLNSASHANMISSTGAALPYSGYYNNSSLGTVGTYGVWWSSTVSNDLYSYNLYVDSYGNVYPQADNLKRSGYAVRCVAQ